MDYINRKPGNTARAGILAGLLMAAAMPAVAQNATAPALPGGASSLQETFQDWRVACAVIDQGTRCNLSQEQQKDGRRLLAIEMAPAGSDGVSGTLVLPFGLHLDAGVTLMVDDKPMEKPFRFSTCLQSGCLVPITLNAASAKALRAGEVLKVDTTVEGSNAPLSFPISLKGFGTGLDRLATLLK